MSRLNPFQAPQLPKAEQREPEHLHGMEDVKAFLLNKIRNEYLPRIRRIDVSLQEHPEQSSERHRFLHDREAVLAQARQLKLAAHECETFNCHPAKFEHVLFDELYQERKKDKPDQEHLNHIRGLLRAGSSFAYERTSKNQEPARVRTNEEALELLAKAQRIESEYWDWRMHLSNPRHQDHDIATELEENKESDLHALELVAQAIRQNNLGDDLESATRTIEDLHQKLWKLSQKTETTSAQTSKTNPWRDAYILLRPLRNFLYYRRLYPVQAKASLVSWSPKRTTFSQ